jgi:Starch-binding associating with outer membrane
MKKILFGVAVVFGLLFAACKKSDFADAYRKPDGIEKTTVEKQYAGFIGSNLYYVVPDYWNYFVVMRTTLTHYTQAVGYVNGPGQYLPGLASIGDRWRNYYGSLAQFREMEKVYNALPEDQKKEQRIFLITGSIYLYDHTQKVIDLHGDIPFSKAGLLSTKGGDYNNSLAPYDKAEDVYTKMLDDLKAFADELNTMTLSSGVIASFKNQDIINKGDVSLWKKYCNSLRLRILARVSGVSAFQARAVAEAAAILGNQVNYPVISNNNENIQMNVVENGSFSAQGFRSGLEDWNGNLAGKAMIDHMKASNDPRLRAMFEPGTGAGGVYTGLDPMLTDAAQNTLVSDGKIAIYNRSTLSRNQNFPGILINAAEVSFLAAEAFLKAGNNGAAKTAYNEGISKSVKYYYALRAISKDNAAGTLTPTNDTEIGNYTTSTAVNWDNAATAADKLKLIAAQKWIHYSVIQLPENWAEVRRLDAPALNFLTDNSNQQKIPPTRWFYPGEEQTYNTANYEAVKAKDNLTTKLFWDVN